MNGGNAGEVDDLPPNRNFLLHCLDFFRNVLYFCLRYWKRSE